MGRDSKVLRVFLSSTSKDLEEHRGRVTEALERMRFQTSRMEVFGARPKTPLAECRRLAAEADLLVVIVAHRYGWIPTPAEGGDGKKSITWWEVEAAEKDGKAVVAFLVDETEAWPGEKEQDRLKADTSDDELVEIRSAIRELKAFKQHLSRQMRDTFESPDELATKVSTSLSNWLQERGEKVTQLDLYLHDLLSRTDHFEIRGIARESRGSEALRPRIENLYIPLWCRDLDSFGEIELTKILPRGKRILIEGQPGAGKSTFLRLVACMLARDLLGQTYKPGSSWRQHYLGFDATEPPLPILLRLSFFVDLLPKLDGRDDRERLLDLLAQQCRDAEVDFDRDFWQEKLEHGAALLLLDGLDEVADLKLRERVFRIFADAEKHWKAFMVVASRPFRTEELRQRGFLVAVVEPFRKEQIQRFLTAWVTALYDENHQKALTGQAERYRQSLQEAILSRPAVRQLAANPVMLTSLCVVHYNDGRLPDARALVYGSVIDWLLRSREQKRDAELGLSVGFAARTLAQLSLALLEGGKKAVFELSEAATVVAPAFERERPGKSAAELKKEAEAWLLFECENSGVLEEIAGKKLRFWHLTFEEFLAARELARTNDGWSRIEEHLDDPQWAEAVELYTTCLFQLFGAERVDQLLQRTLALPPKAELPLVARAVGLFGRLLPAAEACDYKPSAELKQRFDVLRDQVMAIFTLEGAAKVPVKLRIEAAEALGRAGDPRLRPDVDNFLPVPGRSGTLGRYPVTVTEFHRFVENRGYEETRFWDLAGWELRSKEGWETPGDWEIQLRTPNRPVVNVSWYEAMAYCRWLSELCGQTICLPTEAEWEAAATHPKGEYPWGKNEPTSELSNFAASRLDAATPVGIYPAGASPSGHLDLSGNVWEWCADEPAKAGEEETRPLRGGAFWNVAGFLRSAYRYGDDAGFRYHVVGFRVAASPARQ